MTGFLAMMVSVLLIVASAAACGAQSNLPPTAPTAITPSQLPSANPPVTHQDALVTWDGRLLQVSANGESLARTLQSIASRTGVHVTGASPEDRLYGSYGPAPLADVLAQLFEGLPINLLFMDRSGSKSAELILTPRNGSASPPNAYPQRQEVTAQPYPVNQPGGAPSSGVFPPGAQPFPSGGGASPAGAQGVSSFPSSQATDSSNPTGGGNPVSPNGVKTPQEIFEQLQRLRSGAAAKQ